MKKWIWIPILILLIILLSCQKQNKEQPFPIAQEVENKILSAIDQLEKGRVAGGAELLLEAVLLTKPDSDWQDEFKSKIVAAKDQFKNENYDKGVELVSEALLLMKSSSDITDEKDKEEPVDVGPTQKKDEPFPIAPIAEMVRTKILLALDEFKEGNADKGVELILEALVLFSPGKD